MSLQHLSHVQMKLIKVHLTKLNFVVNGKTNNQNKHCWFGLLFSKPMRKIDRSSCRFSFLADAIHPATASACHHVCPHTTSDLQTTLVLHPPPLAF